MMLALRDLKWDIRPYDLEDLPQDTQTSIQYSGYSHKGSYDNCTAMINVTCRIAINNDSD